MKRAIGEQRPIANSLINLGSSCYYLGDLAAATAHFMEALSIYEGLNDAQGSASVLDNLSFVARKRGDLTLAYEYANKALTLRLALGHAGDIIDSYNNTARILIDAGRTSAAAAMLDQAYKRAIEFGEIGPIKGVAQTKAYLYETVGDYRQAYHFQLEYAALRDSLLNEGTLSRIAELRQQYESAEKDRELQFREAQLLRQEAVITQRSQQRNVLIVVAAALLAIFSLVFFSYRARLRARDALNRKSVEMEEMRSHFFANISHEFRTPLTLIQSVADELTEKDVETEMMRTVRANANRLLQLVDQLLDLSRADASRLKVTVRQGDIGRFVRAISASFESLAAQKDVSYTVTVEDPIVGFFDADKLEKIIVNLLSNAFKFTPRKGVIELRANAEGETWSLMVSDTGEGVPDPEKTRIFERFYQVSGQQHYGAGIGLSLTKEFVELQGGSISVDSGEGGGARFRVTLPLFFSTFETLGAVVDGHAWEEPDRGFVPEALQKDDPNDVWIAGTKPSVLIVEDHVDLRRYVKQILADTYQVLEAANGEEGFGVAEKVVPDIIVTDIMMPVMDGAALCEKLKTSLTTSHIPVILLTAKASEEDKLAGLTLGADEYLVKPFSKNELRVRIQNLVRQREMLIAKFSRSLNPREVKLNSADEMFMQKLRDVIERHMDDGAFSVNQLSLELGMSRTQIFRKIQALTGYSASEFVRVVRLNHAAEMLRNKAGSVSEVAYSVGFNNLSYFSKCFKERFGTTPGRYE